MDSPAMTVIKARFALHDAGLLHTLAARPTAEALVLLPREVQDEVMRDADLAALDGYEAFWGSSSSSE